MKKFSKILSVALLVALVLSFGAMAFAEDTEPEPQAEPSEFTGGTFSQTPEDTITVSNLTAGDSIYYYQLVEWDETNSNWKLTTTGSSCGVSLAELLNGITEEEATTIASNVSGDGTAMTVNGTDASAEVDPGLYFLRAVSADGETVYNPAFVSADYYAGGNTVDLSTAIGSSTVLKKSGVPFDKEVTGNDQFVDVKPGDVIPYKITTKVPSYGTQFTNPVFTITDTLSEGLALEGDITVKYGNATTTESVTDVVTITKGTPANGFIVAFDAAYLTALAGATPDVEITYSAKVTTEALNNVTYMDNKAKLTYSNAPGETKDKDDITRHYTFSIDASIAGGEQGKDRTRELIKIGVDDNGETITAFTSWVDGQPWTTHHPLAGAKFTLVGANGVTYTAESDANGYITFNGLDAGSYTLTETEAPSGYVKEAGTHTITITPHYTGTNSDILTDYTITVDNTASSTYTFNNSSTTEFINEFTIDDDSQTWPIVNTKGTELPSTGGIGTTIFYVVGGVLVLAAIILLVTKKRMSE